MNTTPKNKACEMGLWFTCHKHLEVPLKEKLVQMQVASKHAKNTSNKAGKNAVTYTRLTPEQKITDGLASWRADFPLLDASSWPPRASSMSIPRRFSNLGTSQTLSAVRTFGSKLLRIRDLSWFACRGRLHTSCNVRHGRGHCSLRDWRPRQG